MAIRVLALDLERTLISDAMQREPRPGLRKFLEFCCQHFERVVLFTSVNKTTAVAALQECAETGDVSQDFMEKLEYIEWEGKYKDFRFVPNAHLSEILMIDDDGGWILPDQQQQWIEIAEYDPYLVKGADIEFDRIKGILEEKIRLSA